MDMDEIRKRINDIGCYAIKGTCIILSLKFTIIYYRHLHFPVKNYIHFQSYMHKALDMIIALDENEFSYNSFVSAMNKAFPKEDVKAFLFWLSEYHFSLNKDETPYWNDFLSDIGLINWQGKIYTSGDMRQDLIEEYITKEIQYEVAKLYDATLKDDDILDNVTKYNVFETEMEARLGDYYWADSLTIQTFLSYIKSSQLWHDIKKSLTQNKLESLIALGNKWVDLRNENDTETNIHFSFQNLDDAFIKHLKITDKNINSINWDF